MATWKDLADVRPVHYKISHEAPGLIGMTSETDNLRSQSVFLWHPTLVNGAEYWVRF